MAKNCHLAIAFKPTSEASRLGHCATVFSFLGVHYVFTAAREYCVEVVR
jgi:hypothetical protein